MSIVISDFGERTILVPVIGTTELIMDRFSEEAAAEIEAAQNRKAKSQTQVKPRVVYERSIYRNEEGQPIIPALNIHSCLYDGARLVKSVSMVSTTQVIFVTEPAIVEGEHYMRRDRIGTNSGGAQLAYRAGFPKWKAVFQIGFLESQISEDQVLNVVQAGGKAGICAWRATPKKGRPGWAGRFRVDIERMERWATKLRS